VGQNKLPNWTISRFSRRRFSETVRIIGYALGVEAGCRLGNRIGLRISADTILRRIKEETVPDNH
jgi:transposase